MPPTFEDNEPSNLTPKPQKEFKQPRQKSPDECGAVWLKYNGNNVEYLSMKLELDGEVYNIKAFLNSGKVDEQDSRPKWIAYKSKNILKERSGNK